MSGVTLWPGALKTYKIPVFYSPSGTSDVIVIESVSYLHARTQVLGMVGPRDYVPFDPALKDT